MKNNKIKQLILKQCDTKTISYFFEYEQHKVFFSKKSVEERKERYKKLFNGEN